MRKLWLKKHKMYRLRSARELSGEECDKLIEELHGSVLELGRFKEGDAYAWDYLVDGKLGKNDIELIKEKGLKLLILTYGQKNKLVDLVGEEAFAEVAVPVY